MAMAEVLTEAEVTSDNLANVLKRAFFNVSFDKDGDVVVRTDGPIVIIVVEKEKKLIRYMSFYGFKKTAKIEMKHAFANKMNDDIIFARFSIPANRPDSLIADYYIPYDEGIPVFLVVSALRWFAKVVPGAIRACDEHDLVG